MVIVNMHQKLWCHNKNCETIGILEKIKKSVFCLIWRKTEKIKANKRKIIFVRV